MPDVQTAAPTPFLRPTRLFAAGLAGALVYALCQVAGPSDIPLTLIGWSEAAVAAHGAWVYALAAAGLMLLGGVGPKAWRFVPSALAGGIAGLQVGTIVAVWFKGEGPAPGVDAILALTVGAVMAVCGLMVLLALVWRPLGEQMVMEQTGADRAMMLPSAISTICEGMILVGLAVLSVLEPGSAAQGGGAVLVALAVAGAVWGHLRARAVTDEFHSRLWNDCTALAVNLFMLVGVVWIAGHTLGLLPAATGLGALAVFYAVYLATTIAVLAVRFPWMLKSGPVPDAPEQDALEGDAPDAGQGRQL
jgi:hypothetical protein